jgi:ArsR family transcriptional regulator
MPADGAAPDEAAVRFFQALGDATRLRLLAELKHEPRMVGELVEALGCPQPKVSRHLKVLKEAGLVADHREGRNVTYATTRRRTWPAEAREWLDRLEAGLAVGVDAAGEASSAAATNPPSPEPAPRAQGTPPRRRVELDTHLL